MPVPLAQNRTIAVIMSPVSSPSERLSAPTAFCVPLRISPSRFKSVPIRVPMMTAKITAGMFLILTIEMMPIPIAQKPKTVVIVFFSESGRWSLIRLPVKAPRTTEITFTNTPRGMCGPPYRCFLFLSSTVFRLIPPTSPGCRSAQAALVPARQRPHSQGSGLR